MNITPQDVKRLLQWQRVYSGELGTETEDKQLIKKLLECFKDCQELYNKNDDRITYHQMYEQFKNYNYSECYIEYDYSEPDDEYSKMMQEKTDAFYKEQEELEANNPHNYVDPYDDYDPIEKWSDERLDEEIRKAENKYKTV